MAPLREDDGVAGDFARQRPAPTPAPYAGSALADGWHRTDAAHVVALDPGDARRAGAHGAAAALRLRQRVLRDAASGLGGHHHFRQHRSPRISNGAATCCWRATRSPTARGRGGPLARAIGPHYELARTWVLHQQLLRLFGLRSMPRRRRVGRQHRLHAARPSAARRRRRRAPGLCRSGGARWRLAVAWPLGQYLGGRPAARGAAPLAAARRLMRVLEARPWISAARPTAAPSCYAHELATWLATAAGDGVIVLTREARRGGGGVPRAP